MSATYEEAREELDERMERFDGFAMEEDGEYIVYDREESQGWLQSDTFYALDEMR